MASKTALPKRSIPRRISNQSKATTGTVSLFQLQDDKDVENELSQAIIRSAKRTGQLILTNKGLGKVPEQAWKINDLVLEKDINLDFNRSATEKPWWHSEPISYLDLSSNAIVEISKNISNLPDLVTLLLQDNSLQCVPSTIGELTKLTTLNLSRNKLTELPKEFYKLIELKHLNLSNNALQTVDPAMGDLVMLNKLDLSHNNLTCLPPGMGYLVRLTEIDLSHNKLTELPPDIVNLRDLLKFDVTENELKSLPAMGELRRMVTLHCNHNNIEELPDFYGCAALKEIHMANNSVKEITEDFCDQLQHLRILNLRDNKIEKLPDNISLFQHLVRFDITNNNLSKLPSNLGLLSHLQNLQLQGNKIMMNNSVMNSGTGKIMRYLREKISPEELDPDTAGDSAKPKWPDKYEIRKMQTLMLAAKDLTFVPDEVFDTAAAENIHTIDLGKNKFSILPLGITKSFDTMTQLILCCNQLTEIPLELGECHKLQYLELSNNHLSDLPIELGQLKLLREIVLSYNKFNKMPRCIYEMTNLEILLAAENQISEINVSSDAMAKLKFLTVLDLSNNSIVSVPPELGNFTQIRSLEIFGNPFRQPRQAILEKGTQSILSYLRDRISV